MPGACSAWRRPSWEYPSSATPPPRSRTTWSAAAGRPRPRFSEWSRSSWASRRSPIPMTWPMPWPWPSAIAGSQEARWQGPGARVQGSGSRVKGPGSRARGQGLGLLLREGSAVPSPRRARARGGGAPSTTPCVEHRQRLPACHREEWHSAVARTPRAPPKQGTSPRATDGDGGAPPKQGTSPRATDGDGGAPPKQGTTPRATDGGGGPPPKQGTSPCATDGDGAAPPKRGTGPRATDGDVGVRGVVFFLSRAPQGKSPGPQQNRGE